MTQPVPSRPTSPEPGPIRLAAGGLSARFEPGAAFLRDIRWHGHPVLMGVYAAVRDHNWGTVDPLLGDVRLAESPDAAVLTFQATCQDGSVDYRWQGRIELNGAGWVRYDFAGTAGRAFARNRIGFCILHGTAECAGRPCRVQHPAGDWTDGVFPERISPRQPFLDIRRLAWETADGVACAVECLGDIFEMEDQRNWSDASFKTYCTPLERPFPVAVAPGDTVRQSVVLRLGPSPCRSTAGPPAERGRIEYPDCLLPLPRLAHGLGDGLPDDREAELVRRFLQPSAVRHLVDFRAPDWAAALQRARAIARSLDAELDLAVVLGEAAADELACLRGELAGFSPAQCLVLSAASPCTRPAHVAMVRQALPRARLGVGTRGNFAELNRGRPVASGADFVTYAVAATVHAHDRLTVLENMGAAAWTVRDARLLYPLAAVEVAPVSFRQQMNPVATATVPESAPGRLPEWVDARQWSAFGIAYGLGVFAALAGAGARSIGLFDLFGMTGLLETKAAPPRPPAFTAMPGEVFPLFHLVADLRGLAAGLLGACRVVGHPAVPAVRGVQPDACSLLVANPYPEPLVIELPPGQAPRRYRLLATTTAAAAARDPAGFRAEDGLSDWPSDRFELPPESYLHVLERKR